MAQHFGVGPKKSCKTIKQQSFFRVHWKKQNVAKTVSLENMNFPNFLHLRAFGLIALKSVRLISPSSQGRGLKVLFSRY